jgi:hypothetical protein
MSRLIDDLLKVDRTSYQPMGFRTNRQAPTGPRLRLIAGAIPASSISAESVAGADAVLLLPEKQPEVGAIINALEPLGNLPWGIYLRDSTGSNATSLIKEGCDFFVFSAASPVSSVPTDDDIGKILEIESSLDDGLLRAVNNIPVDAILLTDSPEADFPLAWHRLMIFRHITGMLTIPVILRVPLDAAESDLRALWEAGADGLIAEIDTDRPDGIKNLRNLIEGLPARTQQKKERADAVLPRTGETGTARPEPDEEEEDRE